MQYQSPTPPRQRLTRSGRDKMIAGVAGGLADYFDLDPVVVRLIWIAAGVLTGGLAIPVYGLMWWVMPRGEELGLPLGWRSTASGLFDDRGVAPEPVATGSAAAPPPEAGSRLGEEPAGPAGGAAGSAPGGYAPEVGSGGYGAGVGPGGYGAGVGPGGYEAGVGPTGYGAGPGAAGYRPDPAATAAYTSAPPSYPPWGSAPDHRRRRQKTAGVILIGLGLIFLANQTGLLAWYHWRIFWPVVLIALGAGLLVRQNAWRR